MRKDFITSSFRKLPRAALAAFIMIAVTELFLQAARPENVRVFWNKFLVNEKYLLNGHESYDYLILGDSIQKTGIDPRLVGDDLLNLGLPGAKPMGLYLELKRYLKQHNPPKAIFLFVDPDDVRDAMDLILKYFVTVPEFAGLWPDLSRQEKFSFFMRYWVSLDERFLSAGERRDLYTEPNSVFVKTMIANRGFMPNSRYDTVLSPADFKDYGPVLSGISFGQRDMRYFDRIMRLAKKEGIKIELLGIVTPESLYDMLEKSGYNNEYLALLEIFRRVYPELVIPDRPIMYLEDKYFGDSSHMNKYGVEVYSAYFKDYVYGPVTRQDKLFGEGRQ